MSVSNYFLCPEEDFSLSKLQRQTQVNTFKQTLKVGMVLHPLLPITFTLIIVQVLLVEACHVAVSQPEDLLFGRVNQSVSIPCLVTMSACPSNTSVTKMLWYVFKIKSHYQLDTSNQPLKYKLEAQSLKIQSLSVDDDGVYYCAITLIGPPNRGAQAFGNGTTVTVKEKRFNTGQVLLLMLLVLLAIYSLTILSFIFCIKTRGNTMFLQGRLRTSQSMSTSTRRVQFGAVVQELYNKRNLHSNNKISSNEASPENKSCSERESIYQNLHKTG